MENYGLDKTWDQAHQIIINISAEFQKYMALIGPGFDDLGVREGDEKWEEACCCSGVNEQQVTSTFLFPQVKIYTFTSPFADRPARLLEC